MSEPTEGKAPRGQRGGGRAPVDSKTRARVRKLAREGKGRNEIAKLCKISSSTVTRICAQARPPITFDRTATEAATAAVVVDAKARRAQLSSDVLDSARALRNLLTAPHEVIHWHKDGEMLRGQIDKPTSGDVKNYAIALGILVDKHVALTKLDSDDRDLPAVDAWLVHVLKREPEGATA